MFPVVFLAVSLVLCSLHNTHGLYFHLAESKSLCFVQDVPEDTLVKGTYNLKVLKNKRYESDAFLVIYVTISDPDDKPFHSRKYSAEGQFVFTSHKSGEYRICVSSDSSTWSGNKHLRVYLDIWTGDHAVSYSEVANRDKLNELQLRVRQLLDQVQGIEKDQNYQRVREEYFRRLSESTSQRVTYWSIGQLVLLGVIGFWQMRHLRSFFQAKKLV